METRDAFGRDSSVRPEHIRLAQRAPKRAVLPNSADETSKAMNNAVKLALAVALAAPSASLAAPAAAPTPAARGEVKRAPQLPRAARDLQ